MSNLNDSVIACVVLGSKPKGKPPSNGGYVVLWKGDLAAFGRLSRCRFSLPMRFPPSHISPHFRLVYTTQGGWLVWMLQDQSEYLLDAVLGS